MSEFVFIATLDIVGEEIAASGPTQEVALSKLNEGYLEYHKLAINKPTPFKDLVSGSEVTIRQMRASGSYIFPSMRDGASADAQVYTSSHTVEPLPQSEPDEGDDYAAKFNACHPKNGYEVTVKIDKNNQIVSVTYADNDDVDLSMPSVKSFFENEVKFFTE